MLKKIIIILIIFGIFLPSFGSINSSRVAFAQAQSIAPPETFGEAKEKGGKVLETTLKELPKRLEKIWKEEALPLWQKTYNWFKKTCWDPYLGPFFKKEIEKRKPIIEEEFKKEKEELKEEAPELSESLWERFKELIK